MYRIGDFSRLSRVSVKALRFYDEMGLLKPAQVDEATGYRYYEAHQLPRLHRILALKDLGFSLEQIAPLLEEGIPAAELRGMLRLKQAEIQQRMAEEQERLQRVETRLKQIEQEGALPRHEVLLRRIEAQRVLSIRATIPTHYHIYSLFGELGAYFAQGQLRKAGTGIALWHDTEFREQEVDAEAAIPVEGACRDWGRARGYDLPALETAACVTHQGSFESAEPAYSTLFQWIYANGYRPVGPVRTFLLQFRADADPATYVMEIQCPVQKGEVRPPG